MLVTVIVFLLILTILVLIHEAGHFFVAKKLGIRVEEFGFGLPPRAFGKKIGETIYSLNWLPIGGFVKLYGEDEGSGLRAFYTRPIWQRAAVVVAGVFMNFVLAVVIISYVFTQGVGVPTDKVHIQEVLKNTPAQTAGLVKDDIILAVDGKPIKKTDDLILLTKEKLGTEILLTIERKNNKFDIKIIPRKEYSKDQGPMGITISNVEFKKYSLLEAPFQGLVESLRISWLTISGLAVMLWKWLIVGQVPQGVAGPVGVAQITGQAVQFGPMAVISFAGLLSLNLAILNILPIPALDGGRLLFILIEVVTRRRVNPHFERYAHTIGMVILLALIALVTFRDIMRIFSGQPILPTP